MSRGNEAKWLAKNLPNDELDIPIPMFDTDVAYLSRTNMHSLVVCTAYSDIREYDPRTGRRPVINAKLFGNNEGKAVRQLKEQYLAKVFQSHANPHHVYTVTQDGHPVLLDRRLNYKVIKKMPGAKGSVRDAHLISTPGIGLEKRELVVTCGCDRYLRIYSPMERFQHLAQVGSIYLKQRLNCLQIL